MRILRLLVVPLALAALGHPARAQSGSPTPWRVLVSVTAPDDVRHVISGYLSRQLLTLPDVQLVGEGEADFEIAVVATRTRTVSGTENGFALSVAIIKPFSAVSAGLAQALELSPEQTEMLRSVTAGVRDVRELWLRTGAGEDLGRVLQQVVEEFDRQQVEPMRRMARPSAIATNQGIGNRE